MTEHPEAATFSDGPSPGLGVTDEGGAREVVDLRPATSQLFQLNYAEPLPSTQKRFDAWLADAMTLAMAEWQRSLPA